MYKAYKFRLYPNDIQKDLIHKTFGCYRFIYNYFLNDCMSNGLPIVKKNIRKEDSDVF